MWHESGREGGGGGGRKRDRIKGNGWEEERERENLICVNHDIQQFPRRIKIKH